MKIFNISKKILIFLMYKVKLFFTNLKQFHIVYFIIFGLLYYLGKTYLSVDNFNNACYPLLNNKAWYCSIFENVTSYILFVELLFYGIITISLIGLSRGIKKNNLDYKEGYLLYILIPYLIIRIISINPSDNIVINFLNEYYFLIGMYSFWLILLSFIGIIIISKEDFQFTKGISIHLEEKKHEQQEEGMEGIIKNNLPSIIHKILYTSFKKSSFDSEGNKIGNLISIQEINKVSDEDYFIILSMKDVLFDNISNFSKYDWTLGIESFGKIKGFRRAKWKSEGGKNGLLLKITGKRIDLSLLYKFPNLLEDNVKEGNPLDFIIGIDEKGNRLTYDLAELPHILVASMTGGGKSVAITNILVSLMKKRLAGFPIKFLIVDPKMVEFSVFKGLEGFKIETSIIKGLNMSKWLVAEMMSRYTKLKNVGVKNIKEYHTKGLPMEYLVFIVDEFADIMTQGGDTAKEFESAVIRLTQLARAVGIHVILATQNPIGEVITSNIKANMTTRLGLRTSDLVKSRTIIDGGELSTIKYKGEAYMKTGDGLDHFKNYYIDNETELSDFIAYYRQHTTKKDIVVEQKKIGEVEGGVSIHLEKEKKSNIEEKPGVLIHLENKDILKEFELDIDKGIYHIDTHSDSYVIFTDIINDLGYTSKNDMYFKYKMYFIPKRTIERLINILKEKGFIEYDKKEKINKLIGILTKDHLNELYTHIYYVIQK